tara:strand:+ start:193 stop:1257 length:1065 start_codon:yes stop_codon:yes gene_type:complete
MPNGVETVAVLGCTGYVGLELVNILSRHSEVNIIFLGSENHSGENIQNFDKRIKNKKLPVIDSNSNFDLDKFSCSTIFLALPHKVSHKFIKILIKNKKRFFPKIIDLSADFRLNDKEIYNTTYNNEHSCPEFLNDFIYGLVEVNFDLIKNSSNVAIPGCYPTSVLLPLIPLIKNKLIKTTNLIIDSKSGYSGAGKLFDKQNLFQNNELNFYNYNTNMHRHIPEINQELSKVTNNDIKFSFNPHIMPIFRGMMTTIYCDLNNKINHQDIKECLKSFYSDSKFVNILNNENRNDFFSVQYTNNCNIKLFNHYEETKIAIVCTIDNLLKGASGQAVQCMNIMSGLFEDAGLESTYSD